MDMRRMDFRRALEVAFFTSKKEGEGQAGSRRGAQEILTILYAIGGIFTEDGKVGKDNSTQ